MTYTVIPDEYLTVDSLLHSKSLIITESEFEAFKKTPWTWHLLSGEPLVMNSDFYLDAGYFAFASIITIDNTVKNAIRGDYLYKKLNSSENSHYKNSKFYLENKLKTKSLRLNEILAELNHPIPQCVFLGDDLASMAYNVKMVGFLCTNLCQDNIKTGNITLVKSTYSKYSPKFNSLKKYTSTIPNDIAHVKGGYVRYILKNKKTNKPNDIDIVVVTDIPTVQAYIDMMISSTNPSSNIDGIEINPILIPRQYLRGYSFFDMDMHHSARFIEINRGFALKPKPARILLASGNYHLGKSRELLLKPEKVGQLLHDTDESRKIFSAIRKPELIYSRFSQFDVSHILKKPESLSNLFDKNMSLDKALELIAKSSINISNMVVALNNYFDNPEIYDIQKKR